MLFGLRFTAAIGLLSICFTSSVFGEMRFVCPRPQLSNSRMTEGPCGTGPEVPFAANYMELSPGPFTIQLEETAYRKGTPMRIALMEWNSNINPCILLDHIPHNDAATVTKNPECQVNGYPIGRCYTSYTYLTVEIPDVECDRCVLQMINVATDRYSEAEEPCHQTEPGANNCTTYYSCANIRIRPSLYGRGLTLGSCINHQLSLNNRWPYTPAEKYKIDLVPPFDETNYIHLYERPDWSVHYEMALSSANLTVGRGSVALFEGSKPVRFFGADEGTLKILTVDQRSKLRRGAYSIRITARFRNGTFRNFNIPIKGSKSLYGQNMYHDHSAVYSPGGMMAEKRFAGPGATYPQVNFPAGECQAPGIESYGAVLTLYKSVLPRAVVSFTMNRDLMYVHFASSLEMDRAVFSTKWNNTKDESQKQNMGFNRKGVKGVFYEGAAFIGDYLSKTGGRRPTQLSMVIRKEGKLDVLYGDIQKGIKAVLKNGLTTIGLVFMTFPDNSQVFNIYIMISNSTAILTKGYLVSLVGPYESFPISRYIPGVPLDSFMHFYNVSVPIVDLEIPQFLWTGQLEISLHDVLVNKIYTAKLERLTDSVCEASQNIACKSKITLSSDGGPVDRGLDDIAANGIATIGVNSQGTLMDVSISVRDLKPEEAVKVVEIRRNGQQFLNLPDIAFSPILSGENRIYGKVLTNVDNGILEEMNAGRLTLVLTISRPNFRDANIIGRIPPSAAYTPGLSIIQRTTTDQPPPTTKFFDIFEEERQNRERDRGSAVVSTANRCLILTSLIILVAGLL